MTEPFPFVDLAAQQARIRPALDRRIAAVLGHGRYVLGPEVAELEQRLAAFAGAAHAVGVASGTDALQIALMAEGIGAGDAVFVPAFTFPATAEVAVVIGAEPVFVDVDPVTCNIDAADLERRIAETAAEGRLRPRAAIAVDLYGLPADYPALARIADRHGLLLIADAAQSFGASLANRRVGTLAPATATSFFPAKPLGAYGDGGALFTDDGARAEGWRSIRGHGSGGARYDIVRIGLNSRLDTLQAAVLLAKLEVFEDELASRRRIAERYHAALGRALRCPPMPDGVAQAWAQYTVRVARRDQVAAAMRAEGVPTMVYYPRPLHLQPAYARFADGAGSRPVSEALAGEVLSLPMHPYLDRARQDRVVAALLAACGR